MKMYDLFMYSIAFRWNRIQKHSTPRNQHPGVKEVVLLFSLYSKGLVYTFPPIAPGMTEVLMMLP